MPSLQLSYVPCAGDLSGLVKHSQQPLRKVTKINHITSGELKKRSDKHIHIQVRSTESSPFVIIHLLIRHGGSVDQTLDYHLLSFTFLLDTVAQWIKRWTIICYHTPSY